jgi:hypothetical protein
MSANHRNPLETPEGAAWELFMEIRRAEEKDGPARGSNLTERARLLDLFTECLMTARGDRSQAGMGAGLH